MPLGAKGRNGFRHCEMCLTIPFERNTGGVMARCLGGL